jgi:hypothetical protein
MPLLQAQVTWNPSLMLALAAESINCKRRIEPEPFETNDPRAGDQPEGVGHPNPEPNE